MFKEPIPPFSNMDGWKQVPIYECGEKLVKLGPPLLISPIYFLEGIPGAIEEIYVRERVAEKLYQIHEKLLEWGLRVRVWDAWRPLKCQRSLYEAWQEPYISFPNTNCYSPCPHLTGGAVDWSIVDQEGIGLNIGVGFDVFSERAHLRYYEEKEVQPEELLALYSRRIFYWLAISVDFTVYYAECWHTDYLNQFWAVQKNKPAAQYGFIEP